MPRQRSIILISVAGVGLLALVALLGAGVTYVILGNLLEQFGDPFDDRPFTVAAWRAAEPEGRARMCRDLIGKHLTPGTPEMRVVTLLGKPNVVYKVGERDRVLGARRASYSIGNWGDHGMDDAFLYVHYDENDRIVLAEIYGY